jgi:uncharacterized lipoprotein
MTPVRAISVRAVATVFSLFLLAGLGACGSDEIRVTCDEPQPYQAIAAGKRIEVPEDLMALDEYKEMPVPKAESPPRPAGSACIENAPSVLSGGTNNE